MNILCILNITQKYIEQIREEGNCTSVATAHCAQTQQGFLLKEIIKNGKCTAPELVFPQLFASLEPADGSSD